LVWSKTRILISPCRRRKTKLVKILTCAIVVIAMIASGLAPRWAHAAPPARIDFNRQIRPILSDKCFRCHGPDSSARQAGLRLDLAEQAKADRGGRAAIEPGNAAASLLIERITADDPLQRMPPESLRKPLSKQELLLLRTWIDQGAEYQPHWALQPPARSAPPNDGSDPALQATPIDAFIDAGLAERSWKFAPRAQPETILRRVSLDLIGLPPTLDEIESLWHELPGDDAGQSDWYERLVDRLLASPQFGEHWAVPWLDAARYADTNGYFSDKPRQVWLWRDWVVRALNSGMPFDRFTVEQLAGDLLPDASMDQKIATGFNRNHMANNETGIIDEEFRVEYVVDRVNTTMTIWQGMTAGCAQCHDHKFDPLSQREYYQLFAFFNNIAESGLITSDNPPPLLEVPTALDLRQRATLETELRNLVERLESFRAAHRERMTAWENDAARTLPHPPQEALLFWDPLEEDRNSPAVAHGTSLLFERGIRGKSVRLDATRHLEVALPDWDIDRAWTIGAWLLLDGSLSCPISRIEPEGSRRGLELIWSKERLKVHLVHEWGVSQIEIAVEKPVTARKWQQIVVTYDGQGKAEGLTVYVGGERVPTDVRSDSLTGTAGNAEPLRIGRRDSGLGYYGAIDEVRVLQHCVDPVTIKDWHWCERLRGIFELENAASRSSHDTDALLDYYIDRFADDEARNLRAGMKAAAEALNRFQGQIPRTLVMQELPQPRVAQLLERGQYDRPIATVEPGVPSAISGFPESLPRNRLGLARWLTAPENPLTARVTVNRFWQQVFGEGLVRTADDFGYQGEAPTHPELLDWLAIAFRDGGWDAKRLLRTVSVSHTYRQDSAIRDAAQWESDRDNRWLSRGPRQRLSAEMLRDQALAVSGLLVRSMGGPAVKPHQPPGLWEELSYNAEDSYLPDRGEGLWRRSLYTYIKRQAPPPALLTLDGPTREKCVVRRANTDTPMQALLLMNDEPYLEAARVLAGNLLRSPATVDGERADHARIERLWRTVLTRGADDWERSALMALLVRQRARFDADPEAAALVAMPERPPAGSDTRSSTEVRELASWIVVVQTVFNLDEAIRKP
jgi:hypothetical protein